MSSEAFVEKNATDTLVKVTPNVPSRFSVQKKLRIGQSVHNASLSDRTMGSARGLREMRHGRHIGDVVHCAHRGWRYRGLLHETSGKHSRLWYVALPERLFSLERACRSMTKVPCCPGLEVLIQAIQPQGSG